MPLYRTLTRPDLLGRAERQAFANDVVEVHCDITGAPPSFVHVVFAEDDGGQLTDGQNALVLGTIRHGRTDDQKAELVGRLRSSLASRAAVSEETIAAVTVDVEASFTMEGGKLLPEPGSAEEAEWKAGAAPS